LQNLSVEAKWILYVALNLMFGVTLLAGVAITGGSLAALPYVALMFALCSSPIPFIGRLNGAFAMLGVAMAAYFLKFAMLDAVSMFTPSTRAAAREVMFDRAEIVILLGALMAVIGFHVGARITNAKPGSELPTDWPRALLVPIGLLLWSSGCAADLYQTLILRPDASDAAVKAGFSKIGIWGTSGLVLVNYAAPLGLVILAYWWAVARERFSSALMLGIIIVQFAVGWIVDTKEVALNAPLIMLLTRFVTLGKVPLRWLVCSILGIVLVFPVLTAKRAITSEAMHLTNVQALPHTAEILWRAISERNTAREGKFGDKTQTFLERITDKGALEIFVRRVPMEHPYKMGSTFVPMLYTFIPRVIFSDKPGGNTAQLFNREFHLSEDPDTYMSPSHIGELYWNFGIAGTTIGMALIGLVLGFVCACFDLSVRASLTRVLVIIVTLYELVARGEGQIELEYVLWIRTLLLIGILHFLLARTEPQRTMTPIPRARMPSDDRAPSASVRFPHLMR
jgi:hypothetical protein